MLKSVMSDNLILQPSVKTMVPSVPDIFFNLPGNRHNTPTAFALIWDKIFDADIGLFVDVIG